MALGVCYLICWNLFSILVKWGVMLTSKELREVWINSCMNSSPGEGSGTLLQYSCLENPMDGGAWWAAVHGVAGSRTWLSELTFTFHFHALEKEMATHSSVLAWRIPGMGEPGGLPSMGSQRVGHDWSDLAATTAAGLSPTNNSEQKTQENMCYRTPVR